VRGCIAASRQERDGSSDRRRELTSQWREEGGRNKRFYRLSPDGRQMLKQLLAEWKGLNASLDRIV
jgi:DNA-binding PadR family transcriptional regulator